MYEIPITKTENSVSVYPNPARDHITVKSGKPINRLQLFNNGGELLFDKEYNHTLVRISIGSYPEGVYFLKIYGDSEARGEKGIVVR